jgi:hypothetical protein
MKHPAMASMLFIPIAIGMQFLSASAQERQKPEYQDVIVGFPSFDFEKRLKEIEKQSGKEIYYSDRCASLHCVVFKVRRDMDTNARLKELLDKIFSKNEYFIKEGITVSKLKEMCRDHQ